MKIMKMRCAVATLSLSVLFGLMAGCTPPVEDEETKDVTEESGQPAAAEPKSYAEDAAFLIENTDGFELKSSDGSSITVVPAYQGRVMTSGFASGGAGNGWLNYDLIEKGEFTPHISPFGGEDRFWMGPEGGQYAIFFQPDTEFTVDDWQTPDFIDTSGYDYTRVSASEAVFTHSAVFKNWSGFEFSVDVLRTVRVKDTGAAGSELGVELPEGVDVVAYETENVVTNSGDAAWAKESGLLSVWILGMLKPSDTTTVVVPYNEGDVDDLGKIVTDNYFGKVPSDRLKDMGGWLAFSGDGKLRSKIGVSPQRSKDALGSYDPDRGLLTIVTYTLPSDAVDYVNSLWEMQDNPYGGDAVNSYNDGQMEDGSQLGPFYELETSSPALSLSPGESYTHFHRTYHFKGSAEALQPIASEVLGVDLSAVAEALS